MTIAAALSAVALVATAGAHAWPRDFGSHCPRCVSASYAWPSPHRPRLPDRALVFFNIGEFANRDDVWVVDLDSGLLTLVSQGAPPTMQERTGEIDDKLLETLRIAARRAWRSAMTLEPPIIVPGARLGMEVIAGDRMVSLSPEASRYRYLRSPIDQAIRDTALQPPMDLKP